MIKVKRISKVESLKNTEVDTVQWWSSSFQGGGDKTAPKQLEGCSIDMFPHMAK